MESACWKAMLAGGLASVIGCTGVSVSDELTEEVGSKAQSVAEQIGGTRGFGGAMMMGFLGHVPATLGFDGPSDLADSDGTITVLITNETDQDATFYLSYFASHIGLSDEVEDVVVAAGGEALFELPCAEIVGMGPLGMPGEPGCVVDDDETVPNTFAVPMFLGMDFGCGDTVEFALTSDVGDFDDDGDMGELVLVSGGFIMHAENGGPMGHNHRGGMMHGGLGTGGMMGRLNGS